MEQLTIKGYPLAKVFKFNKAEIDKIDFALCKQPRETIDSYYNRQIVKPDVICNGGFFAMSTGNTVFHYVDEDKVISSDKSLLDGIGIKTNGDLVLGRYNESYKDFVSAYPVLIKDGELVNTNVGNELDYNARRTMLGYNDSEVFLVIVDTPGYNFNKCKKLLLSIGVTNAVNLDGGGSSRVLVNGELSTSYLISNRPVDNVVCFYLKKQSVNKPVVSETTVNTIYRVQTGAFSSKSNAEKYRDVIQSLEDKIGAGYKNAYIRLVDGLYKVQVGAFSNKSNAEKVVNDLKEKGYVSFITKI